MNTFRWMTLLAALCLPVAAIAQTKNFNRTVEFAPGGDLRVNTDVGTLRLTAWERPEVEVIVRISGREGNGESAEEIQRSVEMTQIEITGGDGSPLTIKANYGEPKLIGWNRSRPRIEWEIRAPSQLNLELDVDRSEAEVRGFEGRHRLNSDRTVLTVADLFGEVRLGIDRGREVRLANVRGTFQLEADRTDVIIEGLSLTGNSDMQVGRGKLQMQLVNGQGVSVMMNKERRSSFKSDYPLTANSFTEDKIEGTINGGGPRLTVRTDRAQVHLRND